MDCKGLLYELVVRVVSSLLVLRGINPPHIRGTVLQANQLIAFMVTAIRLAELSFELIMNIISKPNR